MNEDSGFADGLTAADTELSESPSADASSSFDLDVDSQPLVVSSVRIRFSMRGSGTSPPDFI